jgi:hypothetical protein
MKAFRCTTALETQAVKRFSMKRHVAATVLGVIGLLTLDNHIDWVRQDHGVLLEINGQRHDPQGWLSEHWRQWRQDCRAVSAPALNSDVALGILQTIQQHSLPDSRDAQLLQLRQQTDWAIAEVRFQTLNPSIVVLRQHHGHWLIQDTAVWSGSAAPWHAAHFVRRYLQRQAPQLPTALLHCMPIDASRYASLLPEVRA